MTTPAIEAHEISKTFGKLKALCNVSFEVPPTSVFCILGPNGAGKSTLLRILTTITRPSHGSAKIEGFDIQRDIQSVRQRIGVVAQDNLFDRYLTVWHNLTLHAQMHGLSPKEYEPIIKQYLEQVGLYDRRFSLPDDLSGGMQRRVALIRALIHRPKVLFLDEPTTGLDPQARLEIWKTIEQFKQSATVVLTTHYMEEAERLSDRIMLLNNGQWVDEGTAKELKQRISPKNQYQLELKSPTAASYIEPLNQLSAQTGLRDIQMINDFTLSFELPNAHDLPKVFEVVPPEELSSLGQVQADLEDVFIHLTNASNQEACV